MKIKVTLTRSDEWVKQQRLERGENVPYSLEAEVEVSQLSHAARAVLLKQFPEYRDIDGLRYDDGFKINRYSMTTMRFRLDCETPSVDQISEAICEAYAAIQENRLEREREVAEQQARREAQERQKRELEERRELARELLASELETGKKRWRAFLHAAKLLSHVPPGALNVALAKYAKEEGQKATDEMVEQLENASPYSIFNLDEGKDED